MEKLLILSMRENLVFIVRLQRVYYLEMQKINLSIKSALLEEASNLLENKKIDSKRDWKSFLKIMNKSNVLRKECLLLPIKATLKALKN